MKNLIFQLRKNKFARVLLIALIVFSFLGLWAHHHEADHGYDCSVCHAVQAMALKVAAVIFFVWIAFVATRQFPLSKASPLFSLFHGAILANRAPPTFA